MRTIHVVALLVAATAAAAYDKYDDLDSYGAYEADDYYRDEAGYGGRYGGYRQRSYGGYGGYGEQTERAPRYGSSRHNSYGYKQPQKSRHQNYYREGSDMEDAERSGYGHQSGYGNRGYQTQYVPVVLKKKTKKKTKFIQVLQGQYIPGGLQMFGKFKDLESCKQACELTPECFSADFNKESKKCYIHGNLTACEVTRAHPGTIHFKKAPCKVTFTPRGLVTFGTHVFNGVHLKDIDTLSACMKKCATMGGGIAKDFNSIPTSPQICFSIDYDFAKHHCYVHIHSTNQPGVPAKDYGTFCPATGDVVTPRNVSPHPTSVNIVMCPLGV